VTFAACGRVEFSARPDAHPDGQGDAPLLDLGPGATYSDLVLASAPRAYYQLEEGMESLPVADASGNGNAAQFDLLGAGTFTFAQPGALASEPSKGVRFDGDGNSMGSDSGASVQFDAAIIDWAADFTVELFWKMNAPNPTGWSNLVFLCENYTIDGFRIGWNDTEQLHAWTTEAGSTGEVKTNAAPIDMANFNHVAFVHEGAMFTLYLDAVAVGAAPMAYIPADTVAECGFGAFHGMPSYSTYDEVAVYPRALSQAELTAHLAAR
jgi:hypothetical protein